MRDRPAQPLTSQAPDTWLHYTEYAYLMSVGRSGFAWEWLRRTNDYRRAWHRRATEHSRRFGLEDWIDPDHPASRARPIWHAAVDPGVLVLAGGRAGGDARDRLNLLRLAAWLEVTIDPTGDEHWLLSDGSWSVRIDVIADTLLAGPLEPRFVLCGLVRLDRTIRALDRLRALAGAGALPLHLRTAEVKARRWISELRVADALAQGATTRQIAAALFGIDVAGDAWKVEHESYRSRTRRLIGTVGVRLRAPITQYWFGRP